jgi:type VI secretion system protein ImpE
MTAPGDLFHAGKLGEAIEAAAEAVRSAPSDLSARWLLAELLIVSGQHDRADQQLDTIMSLEAAAAAAVVPVRHLLRAATMRQDFYAGKGLPEFLDDGPSAALRLLLEATVVLRDGDEAKAGELVTQAERLRPAMAGTCGDRDFKDFRDLDDLTAGAFEVLTKTGKYYWIAVERVERLEFSPPQRPLDLIWRPVEMAVPGAFEAEVFMPAIYGTLEATDEAARLGRRTDWLGNEPAPVRGVGQRVFAIDGEDEVGMLELTELRFANQSV